MKVFISHKQEDSEIARRVERKLNSLKIDTYLDVSDDSIYGDAKRLTEHIKKQMNKCTDILVVMSPLTSKSWWVPFEVGIASNQDFPIVNFMLGDIQLPEFLSYWPRLKSYWDLESYVLAKHQADLSMLVEGKGFSTEQRSKTQRFYEILNNKL